MEIIFGLIVLNFWLFFIVWGLFIVVICIALGLVIGVFPAMYISIKTYLENVNDEITNPIIKWTLILCVGLVTLCLIVLLVISVIVFIVRFVR